MPQLDRLLSVMVSNRADAIQLVENEVATVRKDGALRPITKQPLTGPQLVMLLREIAPVPAVRDLDAGKAASFRYETGDGVFVAQAAIESGKWSASIRRDDAGAEAPADPTGARAGGNGDSNGAAHASNGAPAA